MPKSERSCLPTGEPEEALEWLWTNNNFRDNYPAVYELLAKGTWHGEPRKGGTLTLFIVGGRLKVCFADRHTSHAFYAIVDASGDLWGELEGILAGEHEPWQPAGSKGVKAPF